MPRYRKTAALSRAQLSSFVVLGLFPLAIAIWCFLTDRLSLPWLAAFILPFLAVGFFLQQRRWEHFRCPQCQQPLHRELTKDNSPHTFTCEQCDIIWDTGFIDSPGRVMNTDRSRWVNYWQALRKIQNDGLNSGDDCNDSGP